MKILINRNIKAERPFPVEISISTLFEICLRVYMEILSELLFFLDFHFRQWKISWKRIVPWKRVLKMFAVPYSSFLNIWYHLDITLIVQYDNHNNERWVRPYWSLVIMDTVYLHPLSSEWVLTAKSSFRTQVAAGE